MQDRLIIRDIRFTAPCGVFDEERKNGMAYRADVTLHMNIRPAAQSDDLSRTVDYAVLVELIRRIAAGERNLVECLAEDIATAILAGFHPVRAVTVELTKESPPVQAIRGGVTVAIYRERP